MTWRWVNHPGCSACILRPFQMASARLSTWQGAFSLEIWQLCTNMNHGHQIECNVPTNWSEQKRMHFHILKVLFQKKQT